MTVLLSRAQWKPMAMLVSVAFLPLIILSVYGALTRSDGEGLWILLIVSGVYLLCLLGMLLAYIRAGSGKDRLTVRDGYLEIKSAHISSGARELTVPYFRIEMLEYYRLFSPVSWLQLFNYVLPRSVFITYTDIAGKKTVHIGYMTRADVRALAERCPIKWKIH